MNNEVSETKEKNALKRRKHYKEHHILVKIAFIVSIIALAWAIVFGIIFSITQKPGILGLIIIDAIIIAIALIGLIVSSISFGKGFNSYNISGFVSDIVVIAIYVASIVVAIGLYFQ